MHSVGWIQSSAVEKFSFKSQYASLGVLAKGVKDGILISVCWGARTILGHLIHSVGWFFYFVELCQVVVFRFFLLSAALHTVVSQSKHIKMYFDWNPPPPPPTHTNTIVCSNLICLSMILFESFLVGENKTTITICGLALLFFTIRTADCFGVLPGSEHMYRRLWLLDGFEVQKWFLAPPGKLRHTCTTVNTRTAPSIL